MTHASRTLPSLVKEARALLPTFVAIAAAVTALTLLDIRGAALILMVFAWGVVMLGAQSIGHEYSNRTLPLLLGQPCSRAVILARKAIVLIPLVVALTLITAACLPGEGLQPLRQPGVPQAFLVLAALCAVSLAPLFSMLGRGTLPGTVFAIAIPGVLELSAEFAGTALYGFNAAGPVFAYKLAFVRSSLFCICAAAAVGVWWQFSRLEAVEGHQPLQLPSWRGRGATAAVAGEVSRQNLFVALFRKELHLQQISFVVVALYVVAWLALWMVQHQAPEAPRVPLEPLTVMYLALLSLLIGSVASAEERQLGTLPSQLLLPIAAWKQWAIKAATTIALAVLLAIVLPRLLYAVLPLPDDKLPARLLRALPLAVVMLTALSLYVSSLCGSAVRAMVASIPVAVCAGIYSRFVVNIVSNEVFRAAFHESGGPLPRWRIEQIQTASTYAMVFAAAAVVILLLRFAFVNHRSGEQRIGVTVAQAAILIVVTTIFLAAPVLVWR